VESQTCSGTGDSAVPGAGASQTSAISSITPTEPAVIEITNHYMSATRITINVNAPVSDVSLTITEVNISSGGFQIGFQGLPYQAFEITMKNLSNAEIQNASIEFKVNKTELLAHNLTIDDVFLYRKPANETDWSALNTTYLSNDTNYYYFSSVTPGFSTFLIFASKEECIPAEKRCFQNQVQFCLGNKRWLISEVCDYKCQNGKCIEKGLQINLNPLVVYPIIGIVVVGVLISFFAQRMVKRRMRKRRRR
jgi:PGF-pre-PGF domain-containing protein